MFESELLDKIKTIFDFKKVTYARPGDSQEQEGVFIDIKSARCKIVEKRQIAAVTGTIYVFGNSEKLPYGYFAKKISAADASLTKDLFFFDFEENKGIIQNIAERSVSFHFLFDSQYDPNIGTLNQVNLSYPENE